jgi:hypothetical protein
LAKRSKMFVKYCAESNTNGTGAKECAAHRGMELEHFSANWYHYVGQGTYREAR